MAAAESGSVDCFHEVVHAILERGSEDRVSGRTYVRISFYLLRFSESATEEEALKKVLRVNERTGVCQTIVFTSCGSLKVRQRKKL